MPAPFDTPFCAFGFLDRPGGRFHMAGMPNEPMLCPVDRTPLTMSERQGIEIDYCPTCRGVWLDRGELDKIIERSGAETPARGHEPQPRYSDDDGRHDRDHHRGPRRRSFFEDLFD
jgi:Zn-finger nucleic acid-binding protein